MNDVNSLLEEHTRLVEMRIAELKALKKQIQDIRSACAGGACIGKCGALGALQQMTGTRPPKRTT